MRVWDIVRLDSATTEAVMWQLLHTGANNVDSSSHCRNYAQQRYELLALLM